MSRSPHGETMEEFLKTGARSYLDATIAMRAFEIEVQKRCREVMLSNLVAYAEALAIDLVPDNVEDAELTLLSEDDEQSWNLGVKIVRKDLPVVRRWETWCYLNGARDTKGLSCWCCIGDWFRDRESAAKVYRLFHKVNSNVCCDGKDIWLADTIPLDDVTEFHIALDKLLKQWIRLWKSAGGIQRASRSS